MKTKAVTVVLIALAVLNPHSPQDPNLQLIWDGVVAKLFWQQPANVALTCLLRYYKVQYPSGRCWSNLPEGQQTDVWNSGDSNHAYRVAQGDRFVLCFSQQVGDDFVCKPTAETTMLGPDEYHTYLPSILRGSPKAKPSPIYLPTVTR